MQTATKANRVLFSSLANLHTHHQHHNNNSHDYTIQKVPLYILCMERCSMDVESIQRKLTDWLKMTLTFEWFTISYDFFSKIYQYSKVDTTNEEFNWIVKNIRAKSFLLRKSVFHEMPIFKVHYTLNTLYVMRASFIKINNLEYDKRHLSTMTESRILRTHMVCHSNGISFAF